MELIMASATLHGGRRATDAEGRLVATVQDYADALFAAFPITRGDRGGAHAAFTEGPMTWGKPNDDGTLRRLD
jgi:hypothetical protein